MTCIVYNKDTKEEGNLTNQKGTIMDMKKISIVVGTIFGRFIGLCIIAFISKMTYNVIAYEFNLPTFGFWIHLGVIYVLRYILHDKKINED